MMKSSLREKMVVAGSIVVALCFGALMALPVILNLEIKFALIEFLRK